MATRKQTFIFRLGDAGITEDDLYRLARRLSTTTAYNASSSEGRYDRVQVFTDMKTMIDVLHRAEIRPLERCVLVAHIARRNGDAAVGRGERVKVASYQKSPIPYDKSALPVEMMPRSQHDDTLRDILDHCDTHPDAIAYITRTCKAALEHWSKPGSPQLGSTPATRRSKRSA